jgi:hypothetical protein
MQGERIAQTWSSELGATRHPPPLASFSPMPPCDAKPLLRGASGRRSDAFCACSPMTVKPGVPPSNAGKLVSQGRWAIYCWPLSYMPSTHWGSTQSVQKKPQRRRMQAVGAGKLNVAGEPHTLGRPAGWWCSDWRGTKIGCPLWSLSQNPQNRLGGSLALQIRTRHIRQAQCKLRASLQRFWDRLLDGLRTLRLRMIRPLQFRRGARQGEGGCSVRPPAMVLPLPG